MTKVPVDEKVLEKRLQDAGGAKQLVTKVIDALERAISDYERDRNSFDDTLLDPLKPDLDVLITISEQMAARMQSDADLEEQLLEKAEHAIGDCNDQMRAMQHHLDEVDAEVAKDNAAAAYNHEILKDLQAALEENCRKIDEVRDNMRKAVTWSWVPVYNLYLLGTRLDDLIEKRESTLIDKIRAYEKNMEVTKERTESVHAVVAVLTREKLDMERKINALTESRTSYERRSKVYAAKIVLLSDAAFYYRLLMDAEGEIEKNLDFPKAIKMLDDIKEYVLPTGEIRRDTLKAELIHVAEEYDHYKKHLDSQLAEAVSISFKLFEIHDPLPREYRLATVQEVKRHHAAVLKAMPNLEIANLDDGSVYGARYGGSVRLQVRNYARHKLAVKIKPRETVFKLFNINEALPQDYRLATVQEVENHRLELLKAMPKWEIANLEDGSVEGALYGGSVSPNFRVDVGHKLAVETEP